MAKGDKEIKYQYGFHGPDLWVCNLFHSIENWLGKHSVQYLPHWGRGLSWSAQYQVFSVTLSHDNKQHCSDTKLFYSCYMLASDGLWLHSGSCFGSAETLLRVAFYSGIQAEEADPIWDMLFLEG